MKKKLSLKAPSAIEAMMPYRPMIEAALDFSGGTHLFEDVAMAVQSGDMQFWPAERSCVVTQIVSYPRMRVLHIFLAAGDLKEIKDMDLTFNEFAKKLDCKHVTLSGRKGWAKALRDIGYSIVHVNMAKEVGND